MAEVAARAFFTGLDAQQGKGDEKWFAGLVNDDFTAIFNLPTGPLNLAGPTQALAAFNSFWAGIDSGNYSNLRYEAFGNVVFVRAEWTATKGSATGPHCGLACRVEVSDGKLSQFEATADFGAFTHWLGSLTNSAAATAFVQGMDAKGGKGDKEWFSSLLADDVKAQWDLPVGVLAESGIDAVSAIINSFWADVDSATHEDLEVECFGTVAYARWNFVPIKNGKTGPKCSGAYRYEFNAQGKISSIDARADFGSFTSFVQSA